MPAACRKYLLLLCSLWVLLPAMSQQADSVPSTAAQLPSFVDDGAGRARTDSSGVDIQRKKSMLKNQMKGNGQPSSSQHREGTSSLPTKSPENRADTLWRPNPAKATWLATVVPGLGQIYNHRYWKLPIIYGGFMGCAYAISWNGGMYRDYKRAYRDIIDDDPNTTSYLDILPKGYTVEMMGGLGTYTNTLNSRQQRYHRYRDIAIVATVAVYALSIIDAFVDAQLYDFDISPDLSANVQPVIEYDPHVGRPSSGLGVGLSLTLNF